MRSSASAQYDETHRHSRQFDELSVTTAVMGNGTVELMVNATGKSRFQFCYLAARQSHRGYVWESFRILIYLYDLLSLGARQD